MLSRVVGDLRPQNRLAPEFSVQLTDELLRLALRDDPPAGQDGHVGAEVLHVFHDVRRKKHEIDCSPISLSRL